jgi:hypothetical protein
MEIESPQTISAIRALSGRLTEAEQHAPCKAVVTAQNIARVHEMYASGLQAFCSLANHVICKAGTSVGALMEREASSNGSAVTMLTPALLRLHALEATPASLKVDPNYFMVSCIFCPFSFSLDLIIPALTTQHELSKVQQHWDAKVARYAISSMKSLLERHMSAYQLKLGKYVSAQLVALLLGVEKASGYIG